MGEDHVASCASDNVRTLLVDHVASVPAGIHAHLTLTSELSSPRSSRVPRVSQSANSRRSMTLRFP